MIHARIDNTNLSYSLIVQVWRIGFSIDYWYNPIGKMRIPFSFCHWFQKK
jgi:hypothetical protein